MTNSEGIFNKYAESYQDKYMDVSLYQKSLDRFLELIGRQEAKILDAGCGPGNISKYLLSRSPDLKLTGIDIAANMVELAQKNNPVATFRKMDCRKILKIDDSFDAIIAGFVIPYLSRDEVSTFINDCSELLKTGGFLYLSCMDAGSEKSDYQISSHNKQDKLLTYYHETDFLKNCLRTNFMEIIETFSIDNPVNKVGVTDIVLIARFKRVQ